MFSDMTLTAEVNELTGQLAELVKQVQAGNEVLVMNGDKPVARLIPANDKGSAFTPVLSIRSLKGHKVLASAISQTEIAEEMFGAQ